MSYLDNRISWFVLDLGVVMVLTGLFTWVILFGLARLIPLAEGSLARDLPSRLRRAVAIVIGLRISRWLERRWGDD
jgi:hypothetical protein